MMSTVGVFPFGQTVETLVQQDRGSKKVFVLGVYARAVCLGIVGLLFATGTVARRAGASGLLSVVPLRLTARAFCPAASA